MSTRMTTAIRRALTNVIAFGDTDVFPFPFERYLFDDKLDECIDLLDKRCKNFENEVNTHPPLNIDTLAQVGYTGFRHVTLIDPLWNVCYLALVISIADEIEADRLPLSEKRVFSYRYSWDKEKSSLFQDVTWLHYRKQAVDLSRGHSFILVTDIADHYARVNHHRLENLLNRVSGGGQVKKLMSLLQRFSNTKSYGLPVGGPASRILAELSLVNVDRSLHRSGVEFVRYADDYTIFCDSEPAAYRALIRLAESLSLEGLSLQKSKTRILAAAEFQQMNSFLNPRDSREATDEERLLNLAIRFDPYSPNAEEEYDSLKAAVGQIDILGILSREIAKTAIDQPVTRQAIRALRALQVPERERALEVLLDLENIARLLPVFPQVMQAVRGTYDSLTSAGKEQLASSLLRISEEAAYVLDFEINFAYFVQALSNVEDSTAAEALLVQAREISRSPLVQRLITHTMGNWSCHYYVTKYIRGFDSSSPWEKNALIISSYCLGDEGSHWRSHNRNGLNEFESLVMKWACERHNHGKVIPV